MPRTHVILPDDILRAIDRLVGERGRSGFLEQAARERLERLELEQALRETCAVLDPKEYPEWSDRETTLRWVAETRDEGNP